jgi:YD repeat-containing protein
MKMRSKNLLNTLRKTLTRITLINVTMLPLMLFAQNDYRDMLAEKAPGNVKSIKVWNSTDPGKKYIQTYMEFDKNGNRSLLVEYNASGKEIRRINAFFDNNRQKIKESLEEANKPVREFSFKITYDDSSRVAEILKYEGTQLVSRENYSYPEELMRISVSGEKEKQYTFDKNGKKLSEIDNKSGIIHEHKYDSHGNLIEIKMRPASKGNTRTVKYENEYDDTGRLIGIKAGKYYEQYEYESDRIVQQKIKFGDKQPAIFSFDYTFY